MNWAPSLPLAEMPKVLIARVKYPERVKAMARVNVGDDPLDPLSKSGRHYVLLVRNRVVAIDHPHHATTRFLRAAADTERARCYCFDAIDLWATAGRADDPNLKRRNGASVRWAAKPAQMPPAFLPVMIHRRPPAGKHRRGPKPEGNRRYEAWVLADDDQTLHPTPYRPPTRSKRLGGLVQETVGAEFLRRFRNWLARGKARPACLLHEGDETPRVEWTLKTDSAPAKPVVRVSVRTAMWWTRIGRLGLRCGDDNLFLVEVSPTTSPDLLVGAAFRRDLLVADLGRVPTQEASTWHKTSTDYLEGVTVGVVLRRTEAGWCASTFPGGDYLRGAGSEINLEVLDEPAEGPVLIAPKRDPAAWVPMPGVTARMKR